MAVSFNQIAGNTRVPFMSVEVNPGGTPYQSNQRLLLIGPKTAAGSAPAEKPVIVAGGEDALFGVGSFLSAMYKIARQNAPEQEIWCAPLSDVANATPAKGSIAISSSLTPIGEADSLVYYIDAFRVTMPVDITMNAVTIAADLADAINACPGMTVTATVDTTTTSKVNLVANNDGTLGNSIRIETRLYQDDGALADTISTVVQPTGGAGDPTLGNVLVNLGEELWDWVVMPYCQGALLDQMRDWFAERWGPLQMTYGHCITAMNGTLGTAQTFLSARNNPHETVLPMLNGPQGTYRLAAALGARMAQHMQDAPELSRPLQTIDLEGIRAPKALSDRFSIVARQTLYYTGGSGYTVDKDGTVRLDRVITTYQANVNGQPDASWLDINTIAQIMYGVRYIRQYMTNTYPRCALVNSNPNKLQNFVTVKDIRDGYIHAYTGLVADGVFEDVETFAKLIIVERNIDDASRVDAYLPLDSVNQLRILAANATSFLEYPAAA